MAFTNPVSRRSSTVVLESGGNVHLVDHVEPRRHRRSAPGRPYPKIFGLAGVGSVTLVVTFVTAHASFLCEQINQGSEFGQVFIIFARKLALFDQLFRELASRKAKHESCSDRLQP